MNILHSLPGFRNVLKGSPPLSAPRPACPVDEHAEAKAVAVVVET